MKLGIAFSFMFSFVFGLATFARPDESSSCAIRGGVMQKVPSEQSSRFFNTYCKMPTDNSHMASSCVSESQVTGISFSACMEESRRKQPKAIVKETAETSDSAAKAAARSSAVKRSISVRAKSTSAKGSSKSGLKTEPKVNPIDAKETNIAPPTGDSPLEVCIKNFEHEASVCVDEAKEAKTKCDIELTKDKDLNMVQKMAGKISNGVVGSTIKSMAGTGAADQCAQIALLGNTATLAMNSFKENCDDIYSKCIDTCKTVRESIEDGSAFNKCKSTIRTTEKINEIPAEEYLTEQIERVKAIYNDGDSTCFAASEKSNNANELLNSIGKSTQAAKTCQCQLSASSQQAVTGARFDPSQCAQNVPNPTDCLPGGSLSGSPACNIYANDDCTLGSGKFNSIPCQCAQDNSASVCHTAAGKPAPSNFALDLNSSAGGVSVGAGGLDSSGDASGNMNLDGGYEIKKPTIDSKTSDASTAGGGYANGSGGPGGLGGGGSSGGGSEDPGALGDQEDGSSKGGLSGLFNQVKSSVGDMFGSKNKTGLAGGAKGNSNSGRGPKYNIKDWIPRGVAGTGCQASQLRCKNEDIFTIMSHRYDNNEMTFIQSP